MLRLPYLTKRRKVLRFEPLGIASGDCQPSTNLFGIAENPFKKTPGQKLAEASESYAAYRAEEAATRANMLRLRAERLAREAANPPEAASVSEKPKVRKRVIRK